VDDVANEKLRGGLISTYIPRNWGQEFGKNPTFMELRKAKKKNSEAEAQTQRLIMDT